MSGPGNGLNGLRDNGLARYAIYAGDQKTYRALCEMEFRDIAIPYSLYGSGCTPRLVLVNDTVGVRELLDLTRGGVEGIIVWSSSAVRVESVCRLASLMGLECFSNLRLDLDAVGWAVMTKNGGMVGEADITLINPGCRFMPKRCLKKIISRLVSGE